MGLRWQYVIGTNQTIRMWHIVCGQCVAVCCSVLQCVAVCCSVLQCVAVCCSDCFCNFHTRSNIQRYRACWGRCLRMWHMVCGQCFGQVRWWTWASFVTLFHLGAQAGRYMTWHICLGLPYGWHDSSFIRVTWFFLHMWDALTLGVPLRAQNGKYISQPRV